MNGTEANTHSILDRDRRIAFELSSVEISVHLFHRLRDIVRDAFLSETRPFVIRSLGNLGWVDRFEDRLRYRRFLRANAFFPSVVDDRFSCTRGTREISGADSHRPQEAGFLARTGAVVDQLSTLPLDPV